jgi:RNA polymerase sigma-70 factor, ECF subfamily
MPADIQRFPQSANEFESFITARLEGFVRHAFSLLGNIQDSEDVVQDVILKAFRNREELYYVTSPRNYIHRMISNSCMDHIRKKATRETFIRLSLNEPKQGIEEPVETSMIMNEEAMRVNIMLGNLPEDQALVIRLRLIEEMSFTDIAEVTFSPVTTVKSRFTYGMNKLRSGFRVKKEAFDEL